MPSKFKIGDRVMYQDMGWKSFVGVIVDINKGESGEPPDCVVQLDDGAILACSTSQLAHLDLGEL
jgi:hypothetical protein